MLFSLFVKRKSVSRETLYLVLGLHFWSRKTEMGTISRVASKHHVIISFFCFGYLLLFLSSSILKKCRGYLYAVSISLSVKGKWESKSNTTLCHSGFCISLCDLRGLVCKENNLILAWILYIKVMLKVFFLSHSMGKIVYGYKERIQIKCWPKYHYSQQSQTDGS